MRKIILENFRCFQSRREIPIAPLTILVGENSTGKSSFLAAIKLAWDIAFSMEEPNFNSDPFQLGSFDHIVSTKNKKEFTIGCEFSEIQTPPYLPLEKLNAPVLFEGTFTKIYAQAKLTTKSLDYSMYQLTFHHRDKSSDYPFPGYYPEIQKGSKKHILDNLYCSSNNWDLINYYLKSLEQKTSKIARNKNKEKKSKKQNFILTNVDVDTIDNLIYIITNNEMQPPISLAPIRTRLKRTYDEMTETQQAWGEHIPTVLARISDTDKKQWGKLKEQLKSFGQNSGLFDDISIKRHGSTPADPFQINIKIGRKTCNLIDVGYGVSQVLPILVDSLLRAREGQTFLLQQPEVHLHPRAQAELGTFIARLVSQQKMNFVIETHSDYVLDRILLDLQDKVNGHVNHEDLLILFFKREGSDMKIYPIKVDENGNLIDAPKGYRAFFLKEENRF